MSKQRSSWVVALFVALPWWSCNDDGGPKDLITFSITDRDRPEVQVSGVAVTFKAPCGVAETGVTDALGQVSFPEVTDWSCGPAQLLCVAEDYAMLSSLALTQADLTPAVAGDPIALTMGLRDPTPHLVTFSGTASGMADQTHMLSVVTDTPGKIHQDEGPAFAVEVLAQRSFHWLALEWVWHGRTPKGASQTTVAMAAGEIPGSPTSFTGTLDLAGESIAIERAEVSFPTVPSEDGSLLQSKGQPYALVMYRSGQVETALGVSQTLLADRATQTASGDIAWIEPDFAAAPFTRYIWESFASGDGNQYASYVDVEGCPTAGSQDISFLLPPRFTERGSVPNDETLTWSNSHPAIPVSVQFVANTSDGTERVMAQVDLPPGATSLALADSGLAPDDLVGTRARVTLCDRATAFDPCRRMASSRSRLLVPPVAPLRFVLTDALYPGTPIPGVEVTFTSPCGVVATAVTDAQGQVSFKGVADWTCGKASLTCVDDAHMLLASYGLTKGDLTPVTAGAAIALPLTLRDPSSQWVKVSGTATGFVDPSHGLHVSSSAMGTYYQPHGPNWYIQVLENTPFNYFVMEFDSDSTADSANQVLFQAVVGSAPGATADYTVAPIDFATQSIDFERASVSVPAVPEHASGLHLGQPYAFVFDRSGRTPMPIGFAELFAAYRSEQRAEGGIAWVEPDFATAPETTYLWQTWGSPPAMTVESWVSVPGFPTAGSQDIAFLKPPLFTANGAVQADATLTWTLDHRDIPVTLLFSGLGPLFDLTPVARIDLPAGTTSLALPAAGLPTDALVGSWVRVVLCDRDGGFGACERRAWSRARRIDPAP